MFFRFARPVAAALTLALFAIVLGGKLWVIDRFGSDLPMWDQWDAEGEYLYRPWLENWFSPRDLFRPHNEHRVFFTKALALGLLIANGQWDARLQCVVNAALHSALAGAVLLYARRLLAPRWQAPYFLILAALFVPPVAWHNLLGGFHSQQYFLLWFSLAAIASLVETAPWSPGWWAGVACALAALVSMGSGLLAPLAVAGALLWRDGGRAGLRRNSATLGACAGVFAIGWLIHVGTPDYHLALKARDIADFFRSFWHSLQWPVRDFAPFALLSFAPWGLLAWRLRKHAHLPPASHALTATGLWVLLQFAATAYARGANGDWPSSRYLDTIIAGLVVNALAAGVLLTHDPQRGWAGGLRNLVFAGWCIGVGLGLWSHLRGVWRDELPEIKRYHLACEANVRRYLATGNLNHLPETDIPYPGRDTLKSRLDHDSIRTILPASVRPPIMLDGAAEPPGAFIRGGLPDSAPRLPDRRVWGSFTTGGAEAQGEWRGRPITPSGSGYWRMEVSGHTGRLDLTLEVVSATTGEVLTVVTSNPAADESWRSVIIPAPTIPAALVARDTSPTGWIAFSEPVVLGVYSFWANRIAAQGRLIVITAGIVAVCLLACLFWFQTARG